MMNLLLLLKLLMVLQLLLLQHSLSIITFSHHVTLHAVKMQGGVEV